VSPQLDLVGVALAVTSTLPLIAWRRLPFGVFTVTTAASALLAGLGYRIDLLVGPTLALYFLGSSQERVTDWDWRSTAAAISLLLVYLIAAGVAQASFPASELLHTGLAWTTAWFAGERTRLRRRQIEDLKARAVRAEREAERERLLAVAEERSRIARDLHDSAGNAINVIAIRAGAARLRHHQDPDRSLLALEAIEDVARQTAAEIDQIVGTLRDRAGPNGQVEAPLGLASLETLIARQREAGLTVACDIFGTPRRVGPAADQAVYRILQEALTNAARHGGGSARIGLTFADDWLEVTVTNPLSTCCPRVSGAGHGLIGMRERATLLGGTFDAESANGAFRLRARLPCRGHAA
jgi:signal transduction histidine kinase